MSEAPKVDLKSIPDYVKEELAAVTLECVKDFLSKPEGRFKDD